MARTAVLCKRKRRVASGLASSPFGRAERAHRLRDVDELRNSVDIVFFFSGNTGAFVSEEERKSVEEYNVPSRLTDTLRNARRVESLVF